jgi:pentatricopeptide repeat protein
MQLLKGRVPHTELSSSRISTRNGIKSFNIIYNQTFTRICAHTHTCPPDLQSPEAGGVAPNAYTYSALLKALGEHGQWQLAEALFDHLETQVT